MLLSVTGVKKLFGASEVLSDVTFQLGSREKVALVGRNGSGKTTLLKILTGALEPDSGTVTIAHGAKIGYLRQEESISLHGTVLEEAEGAVKNRLALRVRMDEIEHRMELGSDTEDDREEYALLHEHFTGAEGYSAEHDLQVVLKRLGFEEHEFEKRTNVLSGGEKTRLAIAKLLLLEPDLLILDEPTNHLDLQAVEWLENWLRQYHGAVLLVSHDRVFLDNTAERVLDLLDGRVKTYPGPFQKFLDLRAEEQKRLEEVTRQQESEIQRMDEYVRRFMNSQRTAQARGRQKLMNRLIASKVQAEPKGRTMSATFGKSNRSGDQVVVCEKLNVGFLSGSDAPNITLIKDLDWTVRIGERWGVIGENGAGKTTLIRTALGLVSKVAGMAKLGSSVISGYFSQDTADLDPKLSPLDTLVYECNLLPADARNLLGRFLITGDDVFRPISTLSGGEKNKLAIARLTTFNPNLLILDEPTNHLDMASREALAEVLSEFVGTLILISHDRWLLERTTTHTMDVRKSGVIQFAASFAEYRAWQSRPKLPQSRSRKSLVHATTPAKISSREISKEIERLRRAIAQLEDSIGRDEASLKEIEANLSNPGAGLDVPKLSLLHQSTSLSLADAMAKWSEAGSQLQQLVQARTTGAA